jgi:hypothetical protein
MQSNPRQLDYNNQMDILMGREFNTHGLFSLPNRIYYLTAQTQNNIAIKPLRISRFFLSLRAAGVFLFL